MVISSVPGPRSPRRRIVAIALVLTAAAVLSAATLGAIGWVASHQSTDSATGRGRGQQTGLGFYRLDRPAPPVRLPRLSGAGTISLAALAGKPIVLNFWQSGCRPCNVEAPALASVARAMRGRVTFVGIDSADVRGSAAAFVAKYKVPYLIAFDGADAAISAYGVAALPVTFFLSPSGTTILGENVGALTPRRLRAILGTLYRVT